MAWRQAEREFDNPLDRITNIPELLQMGGKRYGSTTAQLYKNAGRDRALFSVYGAPQAGDYGEITYTELWDLTTKIGRGLREIGVSPRDRVGLFSSTRAEWIQAYVGAQLAGCVTTTVYSVSGPEQLEYLLSDSFATVAFIENDELLDRFEQISEDTSITKVITFDNVDYERDFSAELYSLSDLYERGASDLPAELLADIDAKDLATILYTSGTTGNPKGVCFDHDSYIAAVKQIVDRIAPREDKNETVKSLHQGDRVFSFMPLAHAFEQLAHFSELACGGSIGYAESKDTAKNDIQLIEPYAMPTFPGMFEMIYEAIEERVEGSPSEEEALRWAEDVAWKYSKQEYPSEDLQEDYQFADELVFERVRQGLGGELEVFISGARTLPEDLARFFDACGFTILEGYGMTETLTALSLTPPEEPRIGTMGPPLSETEVDIDESVQPEIDITSNDAETGELLVKGPQLALGYLQNNEIVEFINENGWYRTEDLIERTEDGFLKFIDRKDDVFQLENRLYVFPDHIEQKVEHHSEVDHCIVFGEGWEHVGALIVPDLENINDESSPPNHANINTTIKSVINNVNDNLAPRERIKEFEIVTTEWKRTTKLLTPTRKKRRQVIKNEYSDTIVKLQD